MSIKILTGKTLAKRIAGYGKVAATFAAATHEVAYGAINHVEVHHCASHLNTLYNVTPTNYRGALRKWAVKFGKVAWDKDALAFTYDAKATSDLETAFTVSPAEYATDAKKNAADFDELRTLETFLKKMQEKGATAKTIGAIEGAIRLLKKPAGEVVQMPKAADRKAA
ncbi:hypothetical protein H9Q09_01085 [Aurantimonas sp. DM33-3]|uniref:hypothetical protein n=1 Tax=Aurantimonas sp. DM33-3 TaxID=2766955 RepID=UPI001652435F|nr:hypothetical protein [Aurantimonas sp. DM33-3]MBC6714779.1 hypothetical protein [Aurantimonas sp. DM33-3]